MNQIARQFVCVAVLPAILFSGLTNAHGEAIVSLKDGRRLRGDIAEFHKSRESIELRFERQGIRMSRVVQLSNVAQLRVNGEEISLKQPEIGNSSLTTRRVEVAARNVNAPIAQDAISISFDSPTIECPLVEYLPTRAVTVGVRRDPLDTYQDLVRRAYPNGIPLSETGPALDLMRAKRAQEVFSEPAAPGRRGFRRTSGGSGTVIDYSRETSRQVRTLYAEAVPVSARGKVDWDSLAVRVLATDAFGRVVPVRGTVQATLWGQRQSLIQLNPNQFPFDYPGRRTRVVQPQRGRIQQIANWTRTLGAFHADGSTPSRLVLPLPQASPEHDPNLFPMGNLHIKLTVPGAGVFETTTAAVPLSHAGLIRGDNQLQLGNHFFPGEGTSGSRRRTNIPFLASPFSHPFSIRLPAGQQIQNVFPTPAEFSAGSKDGTPFTVTPGYSADELPAP